MESKAKITRLLEVGSATDNLIAFELLRTELKLSPLEALNHIYQFQFKRVWPKAPRLWYNGLEIGRHRIVFDLEDDQRSMDMIGWSTLALIFRVETLNYTILDSYEQKMDSFTCDDPNPHLLHYTEKILAVIESRIPKLLTTLFP